MSNIDRGGSTCSKSITIIASGLRYRKGPSTSYDVIGVQTNRATLKSTRYKGSWYYFPSIDGWSSSTYSGSSTMKIKELSSTNTTSNVAKEATVAVKTKQVAEKTVVKKKTTNDTSGIKLVSSNGRELSKETGSFDESTKILRENFFNNAVLKKVMHSNGLLTSGAECAWYKKFSRIGYLDPHNRMGTTTEYLFFVKPDLHICNTNGSGKLNTELQTDPFFIELRNRWPNVINMLQKSASKDKNPFAPLLSDSVKSTLNLPEIAAGVIDTPSTIFGSSINYRGEGYISDEKFDFSLEFEDSQYLEVYMFFKAYEEYERLKKRGLVSPPNATYRTFKILHDQGGLYKIICGEDGETIVHYSYICGTFPKSVPRDAFSDIKSEGGLRYSINWEGAYVEDMNPLILRDFNNITADKCAQLRAGGGGVLPVYDLKNRMVNGEWGNIPFITIDTKIKTRNEYRYKLKWM